MQYDKLASPEILATTVTGLKDHGYEVVVAKNKQTALEEIKQRIPKGASVMNGSSTTLEQIGYPDYLATNEHGWIDLHSKVKAENDPKKRADLRQASVSSDYYLGSVHALVENGEFIVASNTGSQMPHIVFTSPNLIFVVSTKKIVPSLAEAMNRLDQHIMPLENEHMKKLYGMGTVLNKIVIFKGEAPMIGRKITFILVEEDLGF